MRISVHIIIWLLCYSVFSQDSDILYGKILTGTEKIEAVNILNLTKGIGAINDAAGFFEIKAKVDDTIVFSSIKHQQKVHIVTKKDMKSARLSIKLDIKINELEEVRISDHTLSGGVEEDIKKIKTYEHNLPMFSAKQLDQTPFINEKGVATIRNTAINHRKNATNFNFIALGRMIGRFFKKKENKGSKKIKIPKLSDFYNTNFLVSELMIPETKLYDFLEYLNENTQTIKILKSENELKILEFIITESEKFKSK